MRDTLFTRVAVSYTHLKIMKKSILFIFTACFLFSPSGVPNTYSELYFVLCSSSRKSEQEVVKRKQAVNINNRCV